MTNSAASPIVKSFSAEIREKEFALYPGVVPLEVTNRALVVSFTEPITQLLVHDPLCSSQFWSLSALKSVL